MSGDKTSLGALIFNLILMIFFLVCWIVNLVQFCSCDFEAPYKKEIIKGVDLTGLSFVTVWIANDQK